MIASVMIAPVTESKARLRDVRRVKERQEHDDLLDMTEEIPDTNIPIKKHEVEHA